LLQQIFHIKISVAFAIFRNTIEDNISVMTRTSTQDGLAAAAVAGISIVLVRQLLNSIDEEEKEICKANYNLNNNNNNTNRRKYTWMPWWWPIIAIQRWKNKQQNSNSIDTEQYEHRGACNCGSIRFLIRGARQLNNQGMSSNNKINSSPSKIRFRCIPISASNFQIVCGENEMRFYYENDDSDNNNHVIGSESNQAQVFCSNCGVTVFHANRKTGNLEINVDCLDDKEEPRLIQRRDIREQSSSGLSSITNPSEHQQQYPRSQSSLSSTALEKDNNNEQVVNKHSIGTLLEDEPFLEGFANLSVAMLGESISPNNQVQPVRKESVSSSDAPTQPESYSIAESDIDDLSMGSSSLTGALPLYHSALSVASTGGGVPSIKTTGLPPLPPASNRISPSDGSIKTLPLWLGSDRPGGGGRRVRNRSFDMNGGWSVSSELNDDLDSEGKSTISPTMRDQMKKYLERHENSKQHHY